MADVVAQAQAVLEQARQVFLTKLQEYGPSWAILRPPALIDQIFIKAHRIRTIEETGQQHVDDTIEDDLLGIINYAIIALIRLQTEDLTAEAARQHYNQIVEQVLDLLARKNADYGDAWKYMEPESYTDLILTKLLRLKNQARQQGWTAATLEPHLLDIINYAIFAYLRRQPQRPE